MTSIIFLTMQWKSYGTELVWLPYRFGTTQGCVNGDRIKIFGCTVALTLSVYSQKAPGTPSHNNSVFVCVFVSGIARRFRTAVCEGDLQGGRGHLLAGTG